jgi:gamma-tubulin complex component 2
MHLIERILPLCSYHDELLVFINVHSNFEYGLISQAFCAALKHLLKEYIQLIIEFDLMFQKAELTLQKLWFHIQPTLTQMECFV